MRYANPLNPAAVDRLVEALELPDGIRVVDVGCGKAELLTTIVEDHEGEGLGVDANPLFLAEAREPEAGVVALHEGDARHTAVATGAFDLGICVGADHALGGWIPALEWLRDAVRPGGWILAATGYWRSPPPAEYLDAMGIDESEFTDLDTTIDAAEQLGLRLAGKIEATVEDWDRYQAAWHRNGSAHDEATAWVEAGKAAYLAGGRECLGFALFALQRP